MYAAKEAEDSGNYAISEFTSLLYNMLFLIKIAIKYFEHY